MERFWLHQTRPHAWLGLKVSTALEESIFLLFFCTLQASRISSFFKFVRHICVTKCLYLYFFFLSCAFFLTRAFFWTHYYVSKDHIKMIHLFLIDFARINYCILFYNSFMICQIDDMGIPNSYTQVPHWYTRWVASPSLENHFTKVTVDCVFINE